MRGPNTQPKGLVGTLRSEAGAMRRAKLRTAACGPSDFVTAARAHFKGGLRSKPPDGHVRDCHTHVRELATDQQVCMDRRYVCDLDRYWFVILLLLQIERSSSSNKFNLVHLGSSQLC